MPRDKNNIGVGRGNGPGSRATQFNSEDWKGNAKGRPPKSAKPQPANPMAHAVKQLLAKKIAASDGERVRMVSTPDAIVHLLFEAMKDGKGSEKVAIARYFEQLASMPEDMIPPELAPAESRRIFLEKLMREVEGEEQAYHRDPDDRRMGPRLN